MMHTEVNGVECPGRNQNEKPKGPRTCLWGRADALKGGGDRGEELTREAAAPGRQSREPRAESREPEQERLRRKQQAGERRPLHLCLCRG